MSWATPLGFIGFIAIGGLILIYLLKPNYQSKVVSSTYIWKLSLKYRKKRIPVSKLRNILLIICQILVLTSCALLLAQPIIKTDKDIYKNEKIVIIDASASMLVTQNNSTRFARAVAQVKELASKVAEKETGKITVILAGKEAELLVRRVDSENVSSVYAALDDLVCPDKFACTYGIADIDGAVAIAEEILFENGDAEVMLYTGTKYVDSGRITIKDVSDSGEFNAAVLNCTAEFVDNYYTFKADVASYNRDMNLNVKCEVYGVNLGGETVTMQKSVRCSDDKIQTVEFETINEDVKIYLYDYVTISLEVDDSLPIDNIFSLYGGTKPTIKVQYYSTKQNIFNDTTILAIQGALSKRWNIDFYTVPRDQAPLTVGFDFYVFEHRMPSILPTDGVVLLIDPDKGPEGSDLIVSMQKIESPAGEVYTLQSDKLTHPVLAGIRPEITAVTRFPKIESYDGYEELITCESEPILLVRNESDIKVGVIAVDLNYSTWGVRDFALVIENLLDYFIPSTLTRYVFNVDESIDLNARGPELIVNSSRDIGHDQVLTDFPTSLTLLLPGSYTLTQTVMSDALIVEQFFVKIDSNESNIARVDESDVLLKLRNVVPPDVRNKDLVMYFAIALIALLFAEWLLQSRDNM